MPSHKIHDGIAHRALSTTATEHRAVINPAHMVVAGASDLLLVRGVIASTVMVVIGGVIARWVHLGIVMLLPAINHGRIARIRRARAPVNKARQVVAGHTIGRAVEAIGRMAASTNSAVMAAVGMPNVMAKLATVLPAATGSVGPIVVTVRVSTMAKETVKAPSSAAMPSGFPRSAVRVVMVIVGLVRVVTASVALVPVVNANVVAVPVLRTTVVMAHVMIGRAKVTGAIETNARTSARNAVSTSRLRNSLRPIVLNA